MSQLDVLRDSPKRSSSHKQSRGNQRASRDGDRSSSNDRASPGSWGVDRGRSRTRRQSNPFSQDNLRRRGYHTLHSSFGNAFHVEKRWKMIRDLGSGAYGVVISAADEISGETVAIKQVNHIFDKVSLAKRALREVTLLRHFNDHENITGLIDIDAISSDFNEIYLFMQPMEADLHQIIKSGQALSNEHVQYFIYQVLRGMKYIHSASVVHRDLKPGNLLVNADCELKICDFGLSRGFDAGPEENATHMTEYVATRWYRAPEIMLAFRRYGTAIDVWSIGCILAELLLGRPLFKGKDYVDQLNKILDILGTPDEFILQRIGSSKAQAYVRSLPIRKIVPFRKLMPQADPQALDLLEKMLAFDPQQRITVTDALEHPWLSSYHDIADEPVCPTPFNKWKDIEVLETLDEFRQALWNEIEEYRSEVRGHMAPPLVRYPSNDSSLKRRKEIGAVTEDPVLGLPVTTNGEHPVVNPANDNNVQNPTNIPSEEDKDGKPYVLQHPSLIRKESLKTHSPAPSAASSEMANDPVVSYARRNSILGSYPHQRQPSASISPMVAARHTQQSHLPAYQEESSTTTIAESSTTRLASDSTFAPIPFPTQQQQQSYIIPARSRTASTVGDFVPRKLLRTLSTVSIHESIDNLAGNLAVMAPIGELLKGGKETGADAPASEMPREFDIEETSEGEISDKSGNENRIEGTAKKEKRFILF